MGLWLYRYREAHSRCSGSKTHIPSLTLERNAQRAFGSSCPRPALDLGQDNRTLSRRACGVEYLTTQVRIESVTIERYANFGFWSAGLTNRNNGSIGGEGTQCAECEVLKSQKKQTISRQSRTRKACCTHLQTLKKICEQDALNFQTTARCGLSSTQAALPYAIHIGHRSAEIVIRRGSEHVCGGQQRESNLQSGKGI